MASPVSMDEIVNATLKGIIKAYRDYNKWSGGEGLYSAPEYLQTVYIAKEIAKIKKTKYLTLEDNIDYILTEANVERKKNLELEENIRENGRADIVLWWASGYARAIIEVKKWVYNINHIQKDLERILGMLKAKSKEKNRLQFSISTFYISRYYKSGDSFNKLQIHLESKLLKSIKKYAEKAGLLIEPYYELKEEDDNFSWGAVSLLIRLKK
jgi:hypothetical protein